MRVGLISFHSFIKPGGVKKHVLGLQKEFKRRGIYSKIIVPRRTFEENYGKDVLLLGKSFPLHFAGTQSDFCINFNPLAIEEILEKERFDVLHFHNFGFPSVWQILEKSNSLNILTFHANLEGSKLFERFPIFLKVVEKIVQWKIDGIIGVAPLNLKYFKNYSGPKIVIPNGIDLEEFSPEGLKIEKFSDGKINILFVGRIEERKGLIYLLKAYKILTKKYPRSLRLIVVGDGSLKKDCQKYVETNNLKEVYFEGEITGKELASYYRSCDIFCSPAIFGESFGLVLVEAMACGKPVVAFANEGYKGVLTGKAARFLANPRDYKTLAKKLEILIKDEKLRKEMGQWGIKEAKNYSWPKIAQKILDFYNLCLKEKQKRAKKAPSLEKSIYKIINKILPKAS
jgi:phosphatidylinositol alpha-mannosyltransferase